MDDFEFEDGCDEVKHNPWSVESIEDFRFYNCPECDHKEPIKRNFLKHAIRCHPKSGELLDSLEVERSEEGAKKSRRPKVKPKVEIRIEEDNEPPRCDLVNNPVASTSKAASKAASKATSTDACYETRKLESSSSNDNENDNVSEDNDENAAEIENEDDNESDNGEENEIGKSDENDNINKSVNNKRKSDNESTELFYSAPKRPTQQSHVQQPQVPQRPKQQPNPPLRRLMLGMDPHPDYIPINGKSYKVEVFTDQNARPQYFILVDQELYSRLLQHNPILQVHNVPQSSFQ